MLDGIKSFINYERLETLTVLQKNKFSDKVINEFYQKSPNRICDKLLKEIDQIAEDRLDTFPTKYLNHLIKPYTHFVYFETPHKRIWDFYRENVFGKNSYSVINNNFPLKISYRPNGTDGLVDFICDTFPENLKIELVPYKYFFPKEYFLYIYDEEEQSFINYSSYFSAKSLNKIHEYYGE